MINVHIINHICHCYDTNVHWCTCCELETIYITPQQSYGGIINAMQICALYQLKLFIKDFYPATFLVCIWLLFSAAPLSC